VNGIRSFAKFDANAGIVPARLLRENDAGSDNVMATHVQTVRETCPFVGKEADMENRQICRARFSFF
jgi:hypothetical protein